MWEKRLYNNPAYQSSSSTDIGAGAGSIPSQSLVEAYYTVVNDFLCLFSYHATFEQATAATTQLAITLPLLGFGSDYGLIGYCNAYDATAGGDIGGRLYYNNTSRTGGLITLDSALSVGAGNSLKVSGQYWLK